MRKANKSSPSVIRSKARRALSYQRKFLHTCALSVGFDGHDELRIAGAAEDRDAFAVSDPVCNDCPETKSRTHLGVVPAPERERSIRRPSVTVSGGWCAAQ